MRISFGHKTVAIYMTPTEKDELAKKWPDARWNAKYEPRNRLLKLMPGGRRGSVVHPSAGHRNKQVFSMGWERTALPADGRLFPTFAVIHAEGQAINDDGVVLKIPEERKRQPAPIIRRNGHAGNESRLLGVLPVKMPNEEPRKLDLLDMLRHYRNKLNDLRTRHPEITFKVKPSGDIGIEVLIEE